MVIIDHLGTCLAHQHLKNPHDHEDESFFWHLKQAQELLKPDDYVAIEGLSFGSIGKTHMLAISHGLWRMTAYAQSAFVVIPVPLRVKLWAVDDARASKAQMIQWAKRYLGMGPKDKLSEHEADALSMALIAKACYEALENLPPSITLRQEQILTNPKKNGLLDGTTNHYRGLNGKQEPQY